MRLAMGATPGGLVRLVSTEALTLAAIGIVIGLVLSVAVVRVIGGLLYGVASMDALTWASAAGLVVVVAFVAAIQPAWRASRTDPTIALRGE